MTEPTQSSLETTNSHPFSQHGSTMAAAPAAATGRESFRNAILRGPVFSTLLRLGLPMVAVLLAQTIVSVAETYWTSFLGTEALAGVSLVFPVLALMTTMSNGGIGGGVSSAVARAMGAGRKDQADALVAHALVVAIAFGIAFTVATALAGPALYAALGGEGSTLDNALLYSAWVFAGSVPIWAVNLIAAALRGAGEVKLPAIVILVGAAILIPASPAFIFGFGPLPRMGVGGAGFAVDLYYVAAMVVLLGHLLRGRGVLALRRTPLAWPMFRSILGVGLVSAAGTLMANLTTILVTGAVGGFGTQALAGYGVASRLDWLLIPLLFGLGTAVVTMVGASTGAGDHARARRVAWSAALLAAAVTETIGLLVAVFPSSWLRLFSDDFGVVSAGAGYLRIVAPAYGAIGLGMILYFACQGRARMLWPFVAGATRLATAAGGSLILARNGFGSMAVFMAVMLGSIAFGGINAAGMLMDRRENNETLVKSISFASRATRR